MTRINLLLVLGLVALYACSDMPNAQQKHSHAITANPNPNPMVDPANAEGTGEVEKSHLSATAVAIAVLTSQNIYACDHISSGDCYHDRKTLPNMDSLHSFRQSVVALANRVLELENRLQELEGTTPTPTPDPSASPTPTPTPTPAVACAIEQGKVYRHKSTAVGLTFTGELSIDTVTRCESDRWCYTGVWSLIDGRGRFGDAAASGYLTDSGEFYLDRANGLQLWSGQCANETAKGNYRNPGDGAEGPFCLDFLARDCDV